MAHIKVTAIFTTAFFMIAAGTVSNSWQLYYMAAIVLALPAVSLAIGRLSLNGIAVTREADSPIWAEQRTPVTLTLTAAGQWPRLCFEVRDILPRYLHRVEPETPLIDIIVGGSAMARYWIQPEKRGRYQIEHAEISTRDPMGLFTFRKRIRADTELIVYPVPFDLEGIAHSGGPRPHAMMRSTSTYRGSEAEADGVRPYVPGDPLRRIHWKTVARTGDLHVLEFADARAVEVHIVLDCHNGGAVGEGADTAFEYLVRAAAAVAHDAIQKQATVSLAATTEDGDLVERGSGTEHLMAILSALARVEPTQTVRLARHRGVFGTGASHTRSLAVLTADADPEQAQRLAAATAEGLSVTVIWCDARSFRPETTSRRLMPENYTGRLNAAGVRVISLQRASTHEDSIVPIIPVSHGYS